MANIQASAASSAALDVSDLKVTTPTITNTVATLADTEYSIALPGNTVRFRVMARGTARLQIAYVSTESGTNYLTVYPGACYEEDNIDRASTTLYIQSSKAAEVIEIVSWA